MTFPFLSRRQNNKAFYLNTITTYWRSLQRYNCALTIILLVACCIKSNTIRAQAADAIITQKSIVGGVTSIQTGVYFMYAVTLECSGTAPCENFVLTDVLPLGLEFDDVSPIIIPSSGGFAGGVVDMTTYNRGIDPTFTQAGQATINFGTVPPGSSGVVLFNVRFQKHGTIPNGYSVINEATVSSDNDLNTSNNIARAPAITATAEMLHYIKKETRGNQNTTLLNNVNVYDIDVLTRTTGGVNYEEDTREGMLALYDPFVIDYLETGLTCADIDVATTTGYAAGNSACITPGTTHTFASGRTFTNPSTTDIAVVYDLEAIVTGDAPYYANPVCPDGASDPLCFTAPGTFNSFSFNPNNDNIPFVRLSLGISYNEPTFANNQVVVNDAALWGAVATSLGGTTTSPIALIDEDNATHSLLRPIANGTLSKMGVRNLGSTSSRFMTSVGNNVDFLHVVLNSSNVPVQATLTDEIPTEVDVNQIGIRNLNAGIAFSVTLTYTDATSETINLVSTGSNILIEDGTDFTVPTNEYVDKVEVVYTDLTDNNSRVYISGTVLANRWGDDRHTASYGDPIDSGNQLTGSPVALDEKLTNCSTIELLHVPSGESFSSSNCAQFTIVESYLEMIIRKSSVGGSALNFGDMVEFQISPTYVAVNPVPPTSYVVTDTLPINVAYVPNSYSTAGGGCSQRNIAFSVSQDATSGRDILTWNISPQPGFEMTYLNGGCRFDFDAVIEEGHLAGSFNNTAYISDFEHPTADVIRSPSGTIITESGVFSMLSDDGAYTVVALPSGDAFKLVDADLTPGVSTSGEVETGSLGSKATFSMVFSNSGNEDLTNLRLVDLLPHIGDITVTTCLLRNTEWKPDFAGNIVSTFVSDGARSVLSPDIQYSNSEDPCVAYYTVGPEPCLPCAGTFMSTAPTALADVQAFGVDFGALIIKPGDSIIVAFEVQIPDTPAPDGIAWNSFAWRAEGVISGLEIGAEPPLVGLTTDEFDVALVKQLNSSTPGTVSVATFSPEDFVTFDIQVVNQGEYLAYDLEVLDYFNPAELTFVNFSNPTVSESGAALSIVVTDSDGSDGKVGFDVSALPAEDTVIVAATFMINPAFSGTTIVNRSEIVAASTTDGGAMAFDVDSDLNITGGNGNNEVDDDIADNSTGGNDTPGDQDDFDFDTIMVHRSFDLALTKVHNATIAPVRPGDTISFDLIIYNQGNIMAYDIDINDYFDPSELTFVNLVPATATNLNAVPSVLGAGPNFELEELAAGDTMIVTMRFAVARNFRGTSIINNAEIVDASDTDGGTTALDEDSPLSNINDGSFSELATDNEHADDSTGGVDNPDDEDDYDAAKIEICTAGCGSFPWNGNKD